MSSQMGSQLSSYADKIEGLKKELQGHVTNLKSATEWPDFERLYRALRTLEEIAGVPKTSLEELVGITPVNSPDAPPAGRAMPGA